MKYLEVLKEKVQDMELKVRETQNERNFYRQKYMEMEEIMKALREREKSYSVSHAQISAANGDIKDKYERKK